MPIADGPERARRLLQTANLKGPRGARTRARPASALRTQNAMHQRRRGPARCGPSRPRNREEHWIPRRGVCASHVPAALQAVAGDPRGRRHRARLLLARTVGGSAQACCKFFAQTQGFPRSRVSCAHRHASDLGLRRRHSAAACLLRCYTRQVYVGRAALARRSRSSARAGATLSGFPRVSAGVRRPGVASARCGMRDARKVRRRDWDWSRVRTVSVLARRMRACSSCGTQARRAAPSRSGSRSRASIFGRTPGRIRGGSDRRPHDATRRARRPNLSIKPPRTRWQTASPQGASCRLAARARSQGRELDLGSATRRLVIAMARARAFTYKPPGTAPPKLTVLTDWRAGARDPFGLWLARRRPCFD